MYLSIVIPCYNEEEVLEKSVQQLINIMNNTPYVLGNFEIILVIEQGTDNSLEKAQELAERYSCIKVLSNDGKYGKGFSVKKGVLNSTGEFVLVTDADLPINLEKYLGIMFALLNYSSESAAVYATAIWDKIDFKKRKFLRSLTSLSLLMLRRLILNQDISDSQLGCKLYRSGPLKQCIRRVDVNGFLYEIYLTDLLFYSGYKIEECAVRIDTFSDKSSVKISDIFSSAAVFFKYSFRVRKELSSICYEEKKC